MNKKQLFFLLKWSGLPLLFRQFVQKNRVTILLFHDISKESAERTFSYLKRNYNIINLNDYIEARQNNDFSKIPEYSLIITFDDGHIRNYELLPILKDYNIKITIFLCSSIANTNRHFWWEYQKDNKMREKFKKMSNVDRLTELSRLGFEQNKEYLEPQALQKAQIEEMKPYVNFQAHTMFHPILPMCTDEEARIEIFGSKEGLEHDFGLSIIAIAYPNGDYIDRDIRLAQEAGYQCGLTTEYGINKSSTDFFRLKRLSVNDTDDMNEMIVRSSGLWGFLIKKIRFKQGMY